MPSDFQPLSTDPFLRAFLEAESVLVAWPEVVSAAAVVWVAGTLVASAVAAV